ncbi:MAG: 6-chlorohydroxyquinol-1,2-dioxygenase [Burkholderiales bacterium]|nr:6-chlorohydroxyquinol-1,2-dioxygenase [Burkholderiales bacterium]
MAIRKFSERNLTTEVLRRLRGCRDRRLKKIVTSFVRHLHAFVREVKPTPEEWMKGIEFLVETGRFCDAKRNEFILLSDTQGVSMLVDALNYRARAGATESTVLGPFHRAGAPEYSLGANIAKNPDDGEPCLVTGTVRDTRGRPIADAKLDVWEAGADGLYDSQKGEAMNLRGIFRTDTEGRFHFRCVKPTAYPVPHDGPAGRLLKATGRHPMRPPHLHFWITAPGFKPLVTHLFVKGGAYLDSDAVFGVKPELVVDFRKGRDGVWRAHYDFVLMREAPTRRARKGARTPARAPS